MYVVEPIKSRDAVPRIILGGIELLLISHFVNFACTNKINRMNSCTKWPGFN